MTAGTIDLERNGYVFTLHYGQHENDENGGFFKLTKALPAHAATPQKFDGTLHDLMQLANEHHTHTGIGFTLAGLKMRSCWDGGADSFLLESERQFIRFPTELLVTLRNRFT